MDEHMEIERRFLVDGREDKPWRQDSDVFQIEQHYTVGDWLNVHDLRLMFEDEVFTDITPTERAHLASTASWTTRLRRRNEQYILTYKARISDDTSLELEWNVEEGMAQRLLAKGPFPSVEKTRYVLTGSDGLTWEIDEFEGALAGLVLAEVELTSSTQAVVLPPWVGQEITGLRSWSNRALAETLASRRG
ncbi:MAG: CYTH domain-containing protein [Candidatus Poseidoniales archaeon]